MRLLLVRHGQATSGPDHRWTTDDPLTEIGLRQAEDVARRIAALSEPPDRIVVSPAVRAQQTAEPTASLLGLPMETDDRLQEFGNTSISPFTLAEMLEHLPYDDLWHPDDPGWDGETIGAFWRRTAAAAEDVYRHGGRPLIVSHAGTTQGLLRWALAIDPSAPDSFSLGIPNASVSDVRLRIDRHGRRRVHLRALGRTDHLTTRTEI
jgi:probable phosphoglycerate mutase